MSVLDYAKKLNKAYKDDKYAVISSIMPNYERLPSKALGFSYCLGGGLPLGRIVIFSGLPHSGKTLACGRAIADYQAKFPDKICVYIDAEHSFDLDFQEKMSFSISILVLAIRLNKSVMILLVSKKNRILE